MSIVRYLNLSGLLPATETQQQALVQAVAGFLQQYQQQLQRVQASASAPAIQWQYQVPELGEGGSCSLFGKLAAEPYDLTAILGGKTQANHALLARLNAISRYYQSHSQSNWFGIYQQRQNSAGETVLVLGAAGGVLDEFNARQPQTVGHVGDGFAVHFVQGHLRAPVRRSVRRVRAQ